MGGPRSSGPEGNVTDRIGFRTVGFREWPLEDALQALGDLGFRGVELCLEHPQMRPEALDESACRDWARRIEDSGLEVASVSYHGDDEAPAARADNQVAATRLAAALGAPVVILNGSKATPDRRAGQLDALKAHLAQRVLPVAADQCVKVALEPEPGHYLHGSQELLALLADLDHPAVGANLDLGHAWLTDPDVTQTVAMLGPRLLHTHWEDMPAGEHRHLVPGTGEMPLPSLVASCRRAGYAGYFTVDLFAITDDPAGRARQSLAAMQSLLNASGA